MDGNKWGWQVGDGGETQAFVPQIVMGRDLTAYAANPALIDQDIRTWVHEHGFNGLHVAVMCRWFDFDQVRHDRIESDDPNPDPRTFEVLEALITRLHANGAMLHIWAWGDEDRKMTPIRWGINGTADRRLQRYIGARLGPLPGWSMGYGFDLWEWVTGEQLAEWHRHLHAQMGWPHLLGGRWEQRKLTQPTEVLDYSSYEQWRPDYDAYVEALEARPGKPVFSEDRFRVRDPSPYPQKDYDLEQTRRGLWHSAMAGGVANIWGYLIPDVLDGGSHPYPNREQILTYARFMNPRFRGDLRRANGRTDGVALAGAEGLLVYKEDTDRLRLDLRGLPHSLRAVAVDTRRPYQEFDLGTLPPEEQVWEAPHPSDWAIAVGFR